MKIRAKIQAPIVIGITMILGEIWSPGAANAMERANIRNSSDKTVLFSCTILDGNGKHLALRNFRLKPNDEESTIVKEGSMKCCHDFTITPSRTDCWAIRAGKTRTITK